MGIAINRNLRYGLVLLGMIYLSCTPYLGSQQKIYVNKKLETRIYTAILRRTSAYMDGNKHNSDVRIYINQVHELSRMLAPDTIFQIDGVDRKCRDYNRVDLKTKRLDTVALQKSLEQDLVFIDYLPRPSEMYKPWLWVHVLSPLQVEDNGLVRVRIAIYSYGELSYINYLLAVTHNSIIVVDDSCSVLQFDEWWWGFNNIE